MQNEFSRKHDNSGFDYFELDMHEGKDGNILRVLQS